MSFCAQPWLVHVPELNPISKEKNLQLLRNLILIQDHGKDHNMDLGKDHKFSTIFHTTQRFNYYNMQKNSHQFGKKDLTSLFLFRFSLNGNIKPIPPPLISVDTSHSISSSSECGIPAVYGLPVHSRPSSRYSNRSHKRGHQSHQSAASSSGHSIHIRTVREHPSMMSDFRGGCVKKVKIGH